MQELHLRVMNEVGLHARPAAVFVREAARFECEIRVRNATTKSDWVDAKSILGVLTLGVEKDHEIDMSFEGPHEAAAAAAIYELVRNDFAGQV